MNEISTAHFAVVVNFLLKRNARIYPNFNLFLSNANMHVYDDNKYYAVGRLCQLGMGNKIKAI